MRSVWKYRGEIGFAVPLRFSGRRLAVPDAETAGQAASTEGRRIGQGRRRQARSRVQRRLKTIQKARIVLGLQEESRGHVPRIEPRLNPLDRPQTADQQPGQDHQHEGAGDLGRDKQVLERMATASDQFRGLALAKELDGRRQTEKQAAQQRQGKTVEQQPPVERHQRQKLLAGNGHPRQQRHGEIRHEQPGRAAQRAQQQTLDQELADDLPARRAHREPDGDLSPAARGAGQQQPGDVGAAGEKHHQRRRPQQPQRAPKVARDVARERIDLDPVTVLGKLAALRVAGGLDGGDVARHADFGLGRRHAVLQAREDRQHHVVAAPLEAIRREDERGPKLGRGREPEGRRRHADNAVRLVVQNHRAADGGRIAAEGRPPQAVRQNHALPVLRREKAPRRGLLAENPEEIRRDSPPQQAGRLAAHLRNPDAPLDGRDRGESVGHRRNLAELDAGGLRVAHPDLVHAHPGRHDPAGLAQTERIEKHGFQHA
jgi:hypothetical protein